MDFKVEPPIARRGSSPEGVSTAEQLLSGLRWTNWEGRTKERHRLLRRIKMEGIERPRLEAAILAWPRSKRYRVLKIFDRIKLEDK